MAGAPRGVSTTMRCGWSALTLASDKLEVTVLPGKGADIYELVDLATGIDPLFKAPWGLQPPGSPPRDGSAGAKFLENYEGSWQELFPNANDACAYRGSPLPFHGEVATRRWSWSVEADDADAVAVRFAVDCELVPFRLERLMRLPYGERRLVLEESVRNTSTEPAHFVWGHHCVLGAPLVAAGAELRVPCRTIVTMPELWEDTARLEPGQRSGWPAARGRDGSDLDISRVPGPEAASHDDVYLTDLAAGWAELRNPALRTGFRLDWDPAVFRWVISWQPYGGAHAMPLRGAYGLGIEPWTAGGNLAAAMAAGDAIELAGGGGLDTTLTASIIDC
jgi:Domain of unknown function (DUF4432)